MKTPSIGTLERLRNNYAPGTRVCLDWMDDTQAPPTGTLGTVVGVDDLGSIMVQWDNGSMLSVVYGEDRCHIVEEEEP